MIRLSVEQLHELQASIQSTGQVKATILPRNAFTTAKLFIAWARSVNQEEFYLAVWQNEKSWELGQPKTLVEVFAEEDQRAKDREFERQLVSGPQMINNGDEN